MQDFKIDALKKAISQFEQGVMRSLDNPQDELIRDGVIQRFEYTMDLTWKLLNRFLKNYIGIDENSIRTKKDIFREAAKQNLIFNAENWFTYYEARNQTSHDYDSEKACAIYETSKLFLVDVKKLIDRLEELMNGD